jgi:hypothetical protein
MNRMRSTFKIVEIYFFATTCGMQFPFVEMHDVELLTCLLLIHIDGVVVEACILEYVSSITMPLSWMSPLGAAAHTRVPPRQPCHTTATTLPQH